MRTSARSGRFYLSVSLFGKGAGVNDAVLFGGEGLECAKENHSCCMLGSEYSDGRDPGSSPG